MNVGHIYALSFSLSLHSKFVPAGTSHLFPVLASFSCTAG